MSHPQTNSRDSGKHSTNILLPPQMNPQIKKGKSPSPEIQGTQNQRGKYINYLTAALGDLSFCLFFLLRYNQHRVKMFNSKV